MNNEQLFYSYSPFIREFIYKRGWEKLHDMQLEAAHIIFNTEDNLLLSSATASGKTEAALFPILSELYDSPASSFGVLYIAPLKSLINDQFERISELTSAADIPVWHWHGDVAASHKSKALREPSGILQITPESLEAMLIRRPGDISRLFCDLRYVIIDEIHALCGTDRGNQIICQLARLSRAAGVEPRRIGLSATVGDIELAAAWLSAGSPRSTSAPASNGSRGRMRLGMEHFFINNDPDTANAEAVRDITLGTAEPSEPSADTPTADTFHIDEGHEFVYDCVRDKKALVFSNSREETEYVTATLRQIAEYRGEPDIFLIHHGNLSASLREEAEAKMRRDDVRCVTCATVTLELGIDIGRLERVVQMGAPHTVSSFLQRLGRSGRREDIPEMMMVFREEKPLPNAPLPQLIPWDLIRGIAIVQLYLEERFVEPPRRVACPYSLMFQQILSILAGNGAMRPSQLAERIYSCPPFTHVPKEDLKALLFHMIENDFLELTDEGELLVGLRGEKLTDSFKFFAVFKDSEDFTVRCASEEIGTITSAPPAGDRFALAGRVWEVEEADLSKRLVYVHPVKGKMEVSWPGDYGEIHTRILERMRLVLSEDTVYPYLKPDAAERLRRARAVARNTGMTECDMLCLGGDTWAYFPWLGTRSFRTMRRLLQKCQGSLGLSSLEFEGCYYMTFRLENGRGDELLRRIGDLAEKGIDLYDLVGESEAPTFNKYDPYVPRSLLRRAYVEDKLCSTEIEKRFANRKV
ncbi:MAG: DEAD/DEAH box helicase [Clostridia bacterium]|nr:DEAD/DEAH box helicase [Clostridia bacterium]